MFLSGGLTVSFTVYSLLDIGRQTVFDSTVAVSSGKELWAIPNLVLVLLLTLFYFYRNVVL